MPMNGNMLAMREKMKKGPGLVIALGKGDDEGYGEGEPQKEEKSFGEEGLNAAGRVIAQGLGVTPKDPKLFLKGLRLAIKIVSKSMSDEEAEAELEEESA